MKYLRLSIIILAVIAAGTILWNFFNSLSFSEYSQVFYKDGKVKLYDQSPVIQDNITSEKNNLAQINVALGENELSSGEKIKLELFDSECKNLIRESEINFFNQLPILEKPGYARFKFDALKDSANKDYCIKITYFGDRTSKELPTIHYDEGEEYSGSSFQNTEKNKIYENASLIFRKAYVSETKVEDLKTLENRISQYKPWFLKNFFLCLIITFFIILSIAFVIILIII